MSESPLRFGFRRRCGWCGVVLRGWQLNLCRRCKERTQDAGLYLQSGGPWCSSQSRWEDEPDVWRGRRLAGSEALVRGRPAPVRFVCRAWAE